MAQDPSEPQLTARSRADTGHNLTVASNNRNTMSSSVYSNTDSSEVSHGSLLDLYARSPASHPDPTDSYRSEVHSAAQEANFSPSPMTAARDFHASSFQEEDASLLPSSVSNASVWTTASAANIDDSSLPNSRRASLADLDSDVLGSIFPISGPNSTTHTAYATPLPPSAAVLPPDFDSDGSNYDDEPTIDTADPDRTARPDILQSTDIPQPSPALYSTPKHTLDQSNFDAHVEEQEFAPRAFPTPPVPKRVSSFTKDKAVSVGGMPFETGSDTKTDTLPGSLPGTGVDSAGASSMLTSDQDLLNSFSESTLQPVNEADRAGLSQPVQDNFAAHEPSPDEQQRLERELLADAAEESRPRTLQEARERARLRKLQGEAGSLDIGSSGKKSSRSASNRSESSAPIKTTNSAVRSSIDSTRERPKRDPRRLSSHEGDRSEDGMSSSDHTAPSDYSHGSDAENQLGYESATASLQRMGSTESQTRNASHRLGLLPPAQVQRPASREMEDLTDAVNDAMDDLSFGSADDTLSVDNEDDDNDDFATPMPVPRTPDPRAEAHQVPTLSSQQLAAMTRGEHSPHFGAKSASIRTFPSPLPSPAIRTPQGPQTPRATGAPAASYFSTQHSRSAGTPPAGTVAQRRQSQQSVQPVMPKRIEVYGKHTSFPTPFASSAIINNRRATSGERARAYAQCTNELLHIPTGLALWMEVVQRPAMRQPLYNPRAAQSARVTDSWGGTMNSIPVSGHVRKEGSYADSIRSDMTFPMRGDGAKAKELKSVMPTMLESPSKPPPNLPYPGVMAPRSDSIQSFGSSSGSSGPTPSTGQIGDASVPPPRSGPGTMTHRSVQSMGGGFFSNLGRKNSKRAPTIPTSGSTFAIPSASSQPSLVNMTNTAPRSRGYRTAREKSISGPGPANSVDASTGAANGENRTAIRNHSVDHSNRSLGLGLGGMDSESSASSARLGTVSESKLSPSIPSYPGTVGAGKAPRSPMGPRAPGSVAASVSPSPAEMEQSESSQGYHSPSNLSSSHAHLSTDPPSQPFGTGPTFLSRLGGGGSVGSSGGSHPSPGAQASGLPNSVSAYEEDRRMSSPEYLHPSLPTTSAAGYAQRSPRADQSPSSPALSNYAMSSNSSHQAHSGLGPGGSSMNNPLRSSFSYGTMRDRMRRESSPALDDATFQETLVKLSDILPDADTSILAHYLRKAKGDDLVAIGDYLQDQSLGKLPKLR